MEYIFIQFSFSRLEKVAREIIIGFFGQRFQIDEFRTWLPTLLNEHPAALTVHLRTKKEMSKVPAHFELIPEIIELRNKISPETKLIINGDIKDRTHALELHAKYPEIDGFMIGRGVFQNPYCFTDHAPTKDELMELLKLHLDLYDEYVNQLSRSIRDNGSELRSEPRDDGREREGDENTRSHTFHIGLGVGSKAP